MQVSAWETKGVIEVEFATGPDAENLEQRVSALPSAPNPEIQDDAGLRILRHLVKRLRHEQFYDRDYLLLAIDIARES